MVKLTGCKSALNPRSPPPPTHAPTHHRHHPPTPAPSPVVCSTDRSKVVVPVLVLLFVAFWFILRGDLFCLDLCYFVLVVFCPFSIAITSRGEERTNLSAFRMFARFALVWFCLFPLPLVVLEGLRFVIVALPGLFSYLFFFTNKKKS